MANDFGTAKSVFILAIVAGCFAILWPNVFYPMITGDYQQPKDEVQSSGCCDVIFDNDINGIKIMTEICNVILNRTDLQNRTLVSFTQGELTKETVDICKKAVLDKCNLDITDLLKRNIGKDYKQTLDLLRTLNSSICLKESFGISLGEIGLQRRMRMWGLNVSKHMKPERPAHLHPEMMHPALREKGRAIQQTQKTSTESRTGTIAGMRPTLGGAGHVVPPPKGGGGTMGIVMPMYTIGIVIFFLYTMLKLMFRKSGDSHSYEEMSPDTDFQQEVFCLNQDFVKDKSPDTTRLGDMELEMLKERLQETEKAMERIVAKMMSLPNHSSPKENSDTAIKEAEKTIEGTTDDSQVKEEAEPVVEETGNIETVKTDEDLVEAKAGVKVIGMEITESCEGGRWSRPETPRPPTPQNIYLPAVLPEESKIIVTNSSTETITSSEDNAPVVLSGKVTLSLIGIQDALIPDTGNSAEVILTDIEVFSDSISDDKVMTEPIVDIVQNNDQSQITVKEDKSLVTNG